MTVVMSASFMPNRKVLNGLISVDSLWVAFNPVTAVINTRRWYFLGSSYTLVIASPYKKTKKKKKKKTLLLQLCFQNLYN